MNCTHDFMFYGDKLGDQAWFCYQCCGDVTYSGLASGWVLVERHPDKQAYAKEEFHRLKDALELADAKESK